MMKEIAEQECQKMISDKELEDVFHRTNFGSREPREIIADTVLKVARGYHAGHTAMTCCKVLKLICGTINTPRLTVKGGRYLFWSHTKE